MADHVEGPLYYERMGRTGPVMAFVHPNPMDQSCWIFQMAHLSTWYRCIAIDIPGYGRSPKATAGLTMSDMAQACWEAIDDAMPGERAILVGCSVGAAIVPYMHHLRPQSTAALVLCGTGYSPNKEHAPKRIAGYTAGGIDYRWDFTFEDLSPAFGADAARALFRADVYRAERASRSAVDHLSVPGRGNPRCRGSSFAHRLSDDHPDRQRGWRASAGGGAEGPYSRLRDEDPPRRRSRLPDRAALAVRPLHDRVSQEARVCFRRGADRASL